MQLSQSPSFVSYSVNREDIFIHRLFADRKTGFYVDVGAAHPTYENDTKALYDRGWHGINVEPNTGFFRELAAERLRDRNLNVAISDTPGHLTFYEVVGTGLSTCDPEEARRAAAKGFRVVDYQVEADTLCNILEQACPPPIDLLKIDVEGFELKVLRSNDWARFRPTLILAEATYPESPTRRPDELTPFLAGKGYRRVYFDGLNDYFVAEEFTLPDDVFDRPPNVFDRFVPYLQHHLTRQHDAAFAQIGTLEIEIGEARNELLTMRQRGIALSSHYDSAFVRIDALETDIDRARGELLTMRQRGVALAHQLDVAVARTETLEAEINQVHEALASVDHRNTCLASQQEIAGARAETLEIEMARSHKELVAMHQRNSALATQLEAMAIVHDRERKQTAAPSIRRLVAVAGTARPWSARRVLRAAMRPRRTMRILQGLPPDG